MEVELEVNIKKQDFNMKKYFFLLFVSALFGCKENTINVNFQNLEDKLSINLSTMKSNSAIYEKKKQTNEIPYIYGENDWYLTYDDTLCLKFRHFKTNKNDSHNYNFKFSKEGKDIFCYINIKGETNMSSKIKFIKCK
jgi:hypothetical protein